MKSVPENLNIPISQLKILLPKRSRNSVWFQDFPALHTYFSINLYFSKPKKSKIIYTHQGNKISNC